MSDLAFATISELSRGLEDKQFSPTPNCWMTCLAVSRCSSRN